ncbi:uncharacterized protein [Clytia hemisphaerica]|uniref:uncharacterized protein n=1 Tax=Clytia hemisphaerica TaxID=252671 RepID=UPI0034D4B0B8
MTDLVSEEQVCAVPGRHIQDHTLLVRELIAYANHKGTPLYIISLDQEKAFDRVDWDFMFQVLTRLGIPKTFIKAVRPLYSNPISMVNVNGHMTDPIPIKRGVRQGCPLSKFLYALVAETIGLAIQNDSTIVGADVSGSRKVAK